MEKTKIVLPIILVVIYTAIILLSSTYLKTTKLFTVSKNEYVNFQANYQTLLLVVTFISIATTYFLNKANFFNYFTFVNINAPSLEMKLFGINAKDSWIKTGLSLTFFISLITGIFMYFQLKQLQLDWAIFQSGILWVLLFSFTNSFAEEMIYRMGIVSPLKDYYHQ